MLIALDAMGGDRAPGETVRGAVLARRELGIEVALTGPPEILQAELDRCGPLPSGIDVIPASEAIGMDEQPVHAVRHKKQASINVAMDLMKRGVVSGVVSAGNTGAVVASALLNVGRIHGVERPAIGTLAPYNSKVLVLDVGANADSKPNWLAQFGQMGSVYMEKVYGVERPRVCLLNFGEEAGKGNDLTQEAYDRLKASGLNFVGNIEGRDVHRGLIDVLVTDGFTGNVAVKTGEGVAEFIMTEIRNAVMSKPHYKLAALVLRPALMQMRKRVDVSEYGGAPLLGINGVVIIAHGRSDAASIRSALRLASDTAASGLLDTLRAGMRRG